MKTTVNKSTVDSKTSYQNIRANATMCEHCRRYPAERVIEFRPYKHQHDPRLSIDRKLICGVCYQAFPLGKVLNHFGYTWVDAGIIHSQFAIEENAKQEILEYIAGLMYNRDAKATVEAIRDAFKRKKTCRDIRCILKRRDRQLAEIAEFEANTAVEFEGWIRNYELCADAKCRFEKQGCIKPIGDCAIADRQSALTNPKSSNPHGAATVEKPDIIDRIGDWIFDFKESAITRVLFGIACGLGFTVLMLEVLRRMCGF